MRGKKTFSHQFAVSIVFMGMVSGMLMLFPAISRGQINIGNEQLKLNYQQPKEYEIAGVTVSGVKYLDKGVLIMISGLKVGDKVKVPGDSFRNAIKKLWDQGLFEYVNISATHVEEQSIFLNIALRERPRLSRFSFNGIKKAEADKIREEIQIVRGDVVNDNLIKTASNRIISYFTEKGYLDATVDVLQSPDTSKANNVILTFDINKNDRIKIYNIDIIGNKNLTEQKILKSFKNTKEKGAFKPFDDVELLIWNSIGAALKFNFDSVPIIANNYINENIKIRIFKSSKYIDSEFDEDKQTLIDKYNALGFRDAKIISDSVYRHDEKTININVKVDEGDRYYFGNITWIGNTKYNDELLNSILRIKKGDIYNKEALNTNLSFNPAGMDVSSLYLDDGYLFFQAVPIETRVENDTIDLEIRIREGKQARINKVLVKGNTKTNDRVIVRELRSRPGQLFSRTDIIRTTRELAQLKYFNPETIEPDIQPNPVDGTVDIIYGVEETSADQIELSGGWGYGRIIGTLGLSFNNFSLRNVFNGNAWRPVPSGDGQKLSLRLQSYGKGYISYSVSFTEPWLGGRKPNAFSVSYYHSLYSNGLSKNNPLRSSFTIDGITFGLGKRLKWPDDFFSLYQAINLQIYNLTNYSSIFPVGDGNGKYNNFNYNIILSRNSVDAPIYARSGSEVSLSLELTPPYSAFNDKNYSTLTENEKYKWIEYHKWKIKANFYTKLIGNLVLSTRTQLGFLGSYNDQLGVTPFERFYLGGDGLSGYNNLDGRELIGMRGYGNETITPDYYLNSNMGGTIYSKYTFEVRYPLSLNPNATIYALTFLEAGNSWANFANFNPFKVYRSAGFGIRVFLPMFGVLGLDWGYGFDAVPGIPGANKGQFHFSINQSID
ncbi:MAG: BamA/TamA family outer membrane protein [Bacteroidales bacterium]|nr:BamA/TamA family outer membrane protein [Bacteroidales bacterium]